MQDSHSSPAQIPDSVVVRSMVKKVLVVEDDVLNRMFYTAVLEEVGYEVVLVHDGANVLAEVEKFRPDVITMDIHLPNISGLELIKRLQRDERTRGIPILAITGYAGRGEEAKIRRAGARSYIAKPVTIARLKSEIEALLDE
jgi:two-component system cell cycle response regulator DivK